MFYISYEKELNDSLELVSKIYTCGFVNKQTVIVNVFPDYSSRLTQLINHKLSFINNNELFQQLSLEVPYPEMSQVWNPYSGAYEMWDRYLHKWVVENIHTEFNYLFVSVESFKLQKLVALLGTRADYKLCSLYKDTEDSLTDIFIQEYSQTKSPLVFEWQNINNPLRGIKPK